MYAEEVELLKMTDNMPDSLPDEIERNAFLVDVIKGFHDTAFKEVSTLQKQAKSSESQLSSLVKASEDAKKTSAGIFKIIDSTAQSKEKSSKVDAGTTGSIGVFELSDS